MKTTNLHNQAIKRIIIIIFIISIFMMAFNIVLFRYKINEKKNELILAGLGTHKILISEINTLFHRVQNDFKYFELKIKNTLKYPKNHPQYQYEVNSQIDFLTTHPDYFKIRLINRNDQEVYKLIQEKDYHHYKLSSSLHNLKDQHFYQKIKKSPENNYYISAIDASIVDGKLEHPLRPTIRVAKKIELTPHENGIIIFNIDGNRILNLFNINFLSIKSPITMSLINRSGNYIASHPVKNVVDYTSKKYPRQKIIPSILQLNTPSGHIQSHNELIVFSNVNLPMTHEKWLLLTHIPKQLWLSDLLSGYLPFLIIEMIFIILLIIWLLREEKQRHHDEVVNVLLQERSEFIQNVSHQLKTPLAIMINSLESNKPNLIELKQEMMDLTKIVEDMLLLAQIDSFQNLKLKNEDIIEMLSECVDFIGARARKKNITILFNLDQSILERSEHLEKPVMAELLKSAITNIIDNAIDFSPANDIVSVLASQEEDQLIIQIKDNGPGIPDDLIPKLFQRFTQGTNLNRKGSGLGLAISKKIIELHHGELKLVQHKNGTIFQIKI